MKNVILHMAFFLACSGATSMAQAKTDHNAVVRLQQLVLPRFKLERATLRQGLDILRLAWTARYPEESFPVIFLESLESEPGSPFGANMDLKNIPALEAVLYLAEAHGMTVRHGLDIVVLRPLLGLDDGTWATELWQLPEVVMHALGLSKETAEGEAANRALRKRLEEFGLKFEPGFDVHWIGNSRQLVIRNSPDQISKAKGLFMLLNAGYKVTKVTPP